MTPALTILAADTKLVEPVASGWQLILRRWPVSLSSSC